MPALRSAALGKVREAGLDDSCALIGGFGEAESRASKSSAVCLAKHRHCKMRVPRRSSIMPSVAIGASQRAERRASIIRAL